MLGIDPGFHVTGFGILKKDQTGTYLLDHGYLQMSTHKSLAERVGIFHTFFTEKIIKWQVTDLGLETPFLGKNAQNFLKLGYLRGILYLLSDIHKLVLHEFSPREVKLALTGFGGADKVQVARVVMHLFPKLPMPAKYDVTDALAITICGLWKRKTYGYVQHT